MEWFDISSVFFTEELLNQYVQNIVEDGESVTVYSNDPFGHEYRSPNQITTVELQGNIRRVITYDSAQNFFQSEKVREIYVDEPRLREALAAAPNPLEVGQVPVEDLINNEGEWDRIKIDVAFKCNWLKFTQNRDLAHALLLTGNRPIVVSTVSGWSEINKKILMVIREDLRRRELPMANRG